MLKLTPNPTFTASLDIDLPGGKKEKVSFVFNYKDKTQYEEFIARCAEGKNQYFDALVEIVSGWDGIEEEFSKDSFALFLKNYHRATQGENNELLTIETRIFHLYVSELTGARLGN